MNTATELAEIPPAETVLQVYQTPNGLDPYIERVRAEVTGQPVDLSTKKGRDAVASRAFKVRKIKNSLDSLGKEQVDKLKEIPKLIDAERKRMRDELDALAEEVRRPLDEWEAAEEARVSKHKSNVAWFSQQAETCVGQGAATIREAINRVQAVKIGDPWQEFATEALRAKADTLEDLTAALAAREKYEAEQAELAELRRKQAEQEQKDREARIAREASERAQKEAEAKAQAEREAAIRREQEAKAAAERRELELKLQAEQAERAAAQAKADKIAAEQRVEQERVAAVEREKQAAEAARQAEIKRQADAQAAEQAEAKRREADKAHKAKINRTALDAFIAGGMPADCAKQAVTLIAKGIIPAVRITY